MTAFSLTPPLRIKKAYILAVGRPSYSLVPEVEEISLQLIIKRVADHNHNKGYETESQTKIWVLSDFHGEVMLF